jgi:sulfatase maturation enzyme AslB (radical SAM superfamily)
VLLPQLTNLDFYGGEPFLLKQLPIILQKAIDIGVAKNIRLHFNSNGSIFPDKLVPMFAQFREVDIALSIDNIGNRFEMERGGQWHDVEKNIIKFLALPVRTYIFPTINIQNVLYFEEILECAEKIGIDVTYNLLHEPKYLNINYMTKAARQLVVSRFSNTKHEILRIITSQINSSAGSDGAEFICYMKEYDRMRSEDFSLTHKEIAHAMGYVL